MLSKSKISNAALLLSSLLLTIGRGATLPFMTIYLTREYQMDIDVVGVAISIALTVGILFSIGFGILADRVDKKRCMLIAIITFIAGFIAIPLMNSAPFVILFFALINCSYSVFATVLKGYFADTLPVLIKAKVFSLNYTFINIGWTIGPPIGTWLLIYSINLPFWLAACTASLPIFFIHRFVESTKRNTHEDGKPIAWNPSAMFHDRVLAWFIISTFLGSLVFGSFITWISQYVITVVDSEFAQAVIGVILPVNAAVVVTLQYAVGRRIDHKNLKFLMTIGTIFFVGGLLGFMWAKENLYLWALAAFIFTLGELIYAPGEYMLIDGIAPDGMKSSYFSAQSLGLLGGALTPMITGFVLTEYPPQSIFLLLIGFSILAWLSMLNGMRLQQKKLNNANGIK
ncbi:efflux MFS transporter YdeE [Ignatzschineria rhizosphaerae]|uniref:Efflux MFS transporter YdeE n=1 Tax=Ignatzschineria rhizosphaerae TaxID=2923279 RepID=A0ABY3X279_9GAMM|nr:efflux MFS transporter YdeE [Ignatzschineria rhizosphaerae]UNM96984.1 efflux MFS transporter YdeE [Ignatzschineria rhizosphaerae]